MQIKINETGKIETLSIIDSGSGVNWVQDLIGNASALDDGQFTWSEEDDAFLADQTTYEWWAKYISDTEATEVEARALADELGISYTDIMERIGEYQYGDYEDHRRQAMSAMNDLREEYAAA